eukprot:TRINITY_DN2769_c0_g1_i1.p1 TRINITY_DN2769_c0_g1~~TRINITY_DN2769_c0_g1_i1.p1  ORF type:complete len:1005 (-),score=286.43 TRINITY_DN2769_c0_g1_i1:489-3503(-)
MELAAPKWPMPLHSDNLDDEIGKQIPLFTEYESVDWIPFEEVDNIYRHEISEDIIKTLGKGKIKKKKTIDENSPDEKVIVRDPTNRKIPRTFKNSGVSVYAKALIQTFDIVDAFSGCVADDCFLWESIHPQENGQPVLSSSGLYKVGLFVGGTKRYICVDDTLPIVHYDGHKSPILPESSNNELWPLILSKALMIATNSSVHVPSLIYCLTGSFPQQVNDKPVPFPFVSKINSPQPCDLKITLEDFAEHLDSFEKEYDLSCSDQSLVINKNGSFSAVKCHKTDDDKNNFSLWNFNQGERLDSLKSLLENKGMKQLELIPFALGLQLESENDDESDKEPMAPIKWNGNELFSEIASLLCPVLPKVLPDGIQMESWQEFLLQLHSDITCLLRLRCPLNVSSTVVEKCEQILQSIDEGELQVINPGDEESESDWIPSPIPFILQLIILASIDPDLQLDLDSCENAEVWKFFHLKGHTKAHFHHCHATWEDNKVYTPEQTELYVVADNDLLLSMTCDALSAEEGANLSSWLEISEVNESKEIPLSGISAVHPRRAVDADNHSMLKVNISEMKLLKLKLNSSYGCAISLLSHSEKFVVGDLVTCVEAMGMANAAFDVMVSPPLAANTLSLAFRRRLTPSEVDKKGKLKVEDSAPQNIRCFVKVEPANCERWLRLFCIDGDGVGQKVAPFATVMPAEGITIVGLLKCPHELEQDVKISLITVAPNAVFCTDVMPQTEPTIIEGTYSKNQKLEFINHFISCNDFGNAMLQIETTKVLPIEMTASKIGNGDESDGIILSKQGQGSMELVDLAVLKEKGPILIKANLHNSVGQEQWSRYTLPNCGDETDVKWKMTFFGSGPEKKDPQIVFPDSRLEDKHQQIKNSWTKHDVVENETRDIQRKSCQPSERFTSEAVKNRIMEFEKDSVEGEFSIIEIGEAKMDDASGEDDDSSMASSINIKVESIKLDKMIEGAHTTTLKRNTERDAVISKLQTINSIKAEALGKSKEVLKRKL